MGGGVVKEVNKPNTTDHYRRFQTSTPCVEVFPVIYLLLSWLYTHYFGNYYKVTNAESDKAQISNFLI